MNTTNSNMNTNNVQHQQQAHIISSHGFLLLLILGRPSASSSEDRNRSTEETKGGGRATSVRARCRHVYLLQAQCASRVIVKRNKSLSRQTALKLCAVVCSHICVHSFSLSVYRTCVGVVHILCIDFR
eukprot:GHVS01108170.1.p1 GENE.GHVS01108170.1~~GHVS01108170.1.p1  ORF type:complete len:128 (+),score=23.53 GHVS01108170.1:211-594(+)